MKSFEKVLRSNPDALPGGTTLAEAQAVDRFLRGQHLGPRAIRRLRSFEKRMEQERRAQRGVDWNERDRILKAEFEQRKNGRAPGTSLPGETGGSAPAGSRARPGAVTSPSAPRHTASPEAGTRGTGGGALRGSGLDARTLSGEDFHRRLAQLGLDSAFHQVDQCSESAREHARSPSVALTVAERRSTQAATERQQARAQQIEATKIDARVDDRVDDREKIVDRLRQLHVTDPEIVASIRSAGKELPPPSYPDPSALAAAAKRRASVEARRAEWGGRVDGRNLDRETFNALLRRRGLTLPSG